MWQSVGRLLFNEQIFGGGGDDFFCTLTAGWTTYELQVIAKRNSFYCGGRRDVGHSASTNGRTAGCAGAALAASRAANLPEPVLLWENGAPNGKGDSDEDKPAIYPFLPAKEKATGCGVVVAPGGAFTHRAMDQEGVTFGKWFAERGIAAFVLRYRIQPLYGRSDYLLDGQRSVQFVKAHAAEYGISPDRVGMIGFSAGSDLTTLVAYQALSPQIDSADVVERQSSKIAFMILAYGGSQPRPGVSLADLPPTFMFCTEEDRSHAGGCSRFIAPISTRKSRRKSTSFPTASTAPASRRAIGRSVNGRT